MLFNNVSARSGLCGEKVADKVTISKIVVAKKIMVQVRFFAQV